MKDTRENPRKTALPVTGDQFAAIQAMVAAQLAAYCNEPMFAAQVRSVKPLSVPPAHPNRPT
jgi:hypothetical protein